MARGNSVLITAETVDLLEAHFEALREFVGRDGVVDAEEFALLRGCKAAETQADVANVTMGVMVLGMHRDGVNGERFQRMVAQLRKSLSRMEKGAA